MGESELLELVAAIYDAASDPALWPVFYQKYAEVVPADYIGIQVHDFRSRRSRFLSSYGRGNAMRVEFNESYRDYYNQLNIWRERGKRLFQAGQIVPTEQHTPLDLLERSEFYNDFLLPNRIKHSFNAVIRRDEKSSTVFSVSRGERDGGCDDSAVRITQSLLPHLARACTIQERLAVLAAGEELINQLPAGVVFLAADGQVVFANSAAEAMIRGEEVFSIEGGRLRVSESGADTALQNAIREAAAPGTSLDGPKALVLERRSSGRPYHVIASPVRRRFGQFAGMRAPAVVVLITDPDQEVATDENLLIRLLSLSRAEGRVAALLLSGRNTAEMALQLGVQENTVRAHLKSMFGKTGARSQAELIKLLLLSSSRRIL